MRWRCAEWAVLSTMPSSSLAPGWSAGIEAEGAPAIGTVAIVGASGALGFGLAVRLGRAGVPIVVGSRDTDRMAQTVERAREAVPGGSFSGCDNERAVRAADTVILSVPFGNQYETLINLREVLKPGQLLIDATVPLAAAVGAGLPSGRLGPASASAPPRGRDRGAS